MSVFYLIASCQSVLPWTVCDPEIVLNNTLCVGTGQNATQLLADGGKVKKNSEDRPDLIPSTSPSVKIQIMCGKVCLRHKGKTLLGFVNKLFVFKSLLTTPQQCFASTFRANFPAHNLNFH